MIYYVDGFTIGKNPSLHGGGFTVVNERNELIKRHTFRQFAYKFFTNNEAELWSIAYGVWVAQPKDIVRTDSQTAFYWCKNGRAKARADLNVLAVRTHKQILEKDVFLEYVPREENLAGHYNEAHPETNDDICPRCGGSFDATGGKPAPGYPYHCQKCAAEDWCAEQDSYKS